MEVASGWLSDHYDPSSRVLRLSPEVYESHTATAVGIAAHEAGHALQHATHYAPLVVRNAAVPAAQVGPTLSIILLMLGAVLGKPSLIVLGLLAFSMIVVFQLVNLPVEFDASNRAKRLLGQLNIVDEEARTSRAERAQRRRLDLRRCDTAIHSYAGVLPVPIQRSLEFARRLIAGLEASKSLAAADHRTMHERRRDGQQGQP